MESNKSISITVHTIVNLTVDKVWQFWTNPDDIVKWNNASEDWHTTKATNDLRIGGRFTYRMEAKDGSMSFDFGGVYNNIILHKQIDYVLDDDRKVSIIFTATNNTTEIQETFEAETENSIELQRFGWQCIMDNFKKYAEQNQ